MAKRCGGGCGKSSATATATGIGAQKESEVWGPKLWQRFHRWTLRERGEDAGYLVNFLRTIPCAECRAHFAALLAASPPRWGDLFAWGVEVHNAVNARLGAPAWTIEAARVRWQAEEHAVPSVPSATLPMKNRTIHQVWIQGADQLPPAFIKNRADWQAALPPGWSMRLWSGEDAIARWPDLREILPLCSAHAMRADLILARCLRDLGGLTMGTDCQPVNPAGLFAFCEALPTLIVVDGAEPEISNGLAWAAAPGHPFFACVARHQLRDRALLRGKNVPAVTGPQAWWQAWRARRWDLCMVSVRHAYTRQWRERGVINEAAWLNPGYAASWWGATTGK